MGRGLRAVIGLVAGYVLGALIGWALISLLSGNRHDKALEAVMTAAFATGPLGAIVGAIAGALTGRGKA